MSRRFSPRALNQRTTDTLDLADHDFHSDEIWEVDDPADDDDDLVVIDESDESDDELTDTAYDNDWDDYWRRRRAGERPS